MAPTDVAVRVVAGWSLPGDGGWMLFVSDIVDSLLVGINGTLFIVAVLVLPLYLLGKGVEFLLGSSEGTETDSLGGDDTSRLPWISSKGSETGGRSDSIGSSRRDGRAVGPTDPPSTCPPPPSVPTPVERPDLIRSGWVGAGPNAMVHRAVVGYGPDAPTVAVKEPDDDAVPDGGDRFLEAVRTWDRLDDHPNVLGVLVRGRSPGPWVAIEYGDAGPLADRTGDMSLDQALWTTTSIAAAVERAHAEGVAHLALSPDNVVLRGTDEGWAVPKVADWQVARVLAEDGRAHTETAPAYAAPEQHHDRFGTPGPGTDVYALGAICCELVTGRPPFEGGLDQIGSAMVSEAPPAPTDLDPSLPAELDDVLLSALTPERAGRIDDVTYLRERLEEIYEEVREG